MAQHDYTIANQTAPNFRSDLNNALEAAATNNSGGSAPPTTYPNMIYYDTNDQIIYLRNAADDAWIKMFYVDQTKNEIGIFNDTILSSATGAIEIGLVGDLDQSTWNTGTDDREALISPQKLKGVIDQSADGVSFIERQSFNNVSTVDFDLPDQSTYETYEFIFQGISSTNEDPIEWRASNDGGSTFISTSSYLNSSGGSTTSGRILFVDAGNTVNYNAKARFFNATTSKWTSVVAEGSGTSTGTNLVAAQGASHLQVTESHNAIRFFASTGNMSGIISLYGYTR